MEGIQ